MVCIMSQTPLPISFDGRPGTITDMGPRLYMVSEPPRVREHGVNSDPPGVAVAGKRKSSRLRPEQPPIE
jgi:hypothetical protein